MHENNILRSTIPLTLKIITSPISTMATKLRLLRKQCEDAQLVNKKANNFKGSYLYWCTHTTPFRGSLENDEIISSFIKSNNYVKGVDFAIDANDFQKVLKKGEHKQALIQCLEKLEARRNVRLMKLGFVSFTRAKTSTHKKALIQCLAKHEARRNFHLMKFGFVSFTRANTINDPSCDDSVAENPECCVEGCVLEGLHLRRDATMKTNPKYFCNKHKKRKLENIEWVKKPEGGYFHFEKIYEGKGRRPRLNKDRLQTNKESKAAGKRKQEQHLKKIGDQMQMKMDNLENENVYLKKELETARDKIQVLNQTIIELQQTVISLSVPNGPFAKKQRIVPPVPSPQRIVPPVPSPLQVTNMAQSFSATENDFDSIAQYLG